MNEYLRQFKKKQVCAAPELLEEKEVSEPVPAPTPPPIWQRLKSAVEYLLLPEESEDEDEDIDLQCRAIPQIEDDDLFPDYEQKEIEINAESEYFDQQRADIIEMMKEEEKLVDEEMALENAEIKDLTAEIHEKLKTVSSKNIQPELYSAAKKVHSKLKTAQFYKQKLSDRQRTLQSILDASLDKIKKENKKSRKTTFFNRFSQTPTETEASLDLLQKETEELNVLIAQLYQDIQTIIEDMRAMVRTEIDLIYLNDDMYQKIREVFPEFNTVDIDDLSPQNLDVFVVKLEKSIHDTMPELEEVEEENEYIDIDRGFDFSTGIPPKYETMEPIIPNEFEFEAYIPKPPPVRVRTEEDFNFDVSFEDHVKDTINEPVDQFMAPEYPHGLIDEEIYDIPVTPKSKKPRIFDFEISAIGEMESHAPYTQSFIGPRVYDFDIQPEPVTPSIQPDEKIDRSEREEDDEKREYDTLIAEVDELAETKKNLENLDEMKENLEEMGTDAGQRRQLRKINRKWIEKEKEQLKAKGPAVFKERTIPEPQITSPAFKTRKRRLELERKEEKEPDKKRQKKDIEIKGEYELTIESQEAKVDEIGENVLRLTQDLFRAKHDLIVNKNKLKFISDDNLSAKQNIQNINAYIENEIRQITDSLNKMEILQKNEQEILQKLQLKASTWSAALKEIEPLPPKSSWGKIDWISWNDNKNRPIIGTDDISLLLRLTRYRVGPAEMEILSRRLKSKFDNFYRYVMRIPKLIVVNPAALLLKENILKLVQTSEIKLKLQKNDPIGILEYLIDGESYNENGAYLFSWETNTMNDIFFATHDIKYFEIMEPRLLLTLADNYGFWLDEDYVSLTSTLISLLKRPELVGSIQAHENDIIKRFHAIHEQQNLETVIEIQTVEFAPLLYYNTVQHIIEVGFLKTSTNSPNVIVKSGDDYIVHFQTIDVSTDPNDASTTNRELKIFENNNKWKNVIFIEGRGVVLELFRPISENPVERTVQFIQAKGELKSAHPSYQRILPDLQNNLTDFDMTLAACCIEAYKSKKNRKHTIHIKLPFSDAEDMKYDNTYSTDFYAHYESANVIVVAFQGADIFYPTIFTAAAKEFISTYFQKLNPIKDDSFIKSATAKLLDLTNINKKIILTGHSYGVTILINALYENRFFDTFFETVTFAGFIPSASDARYSWYAQSVFFRKFVFIEDNFANWIYQIPNRKYLMSYSDPSKKLQKINPTTYGKWLETHSIHRFTEKETNSLAIGLDDNELYNF